MDCERQLQRWLAGGVLDAASADRIRQFEAGQAVPSQQVERFRWPMIVALVFGALLLGAGMLLFVSAHWDELSPAQRLSLVVLMVAVFHVGGAAAASRFDALSIALHTVGTFALGAGIGLTGQIYHLSEHWPSAVLLWAAGALVAWALLRHWTQGALAAILLPAWLCAEWLFTAGGNPDSGVRPVLAGICALALTYLSAPPSSTLNKALVWIGAIALLPSAILTAIDVWGRSTPSANEWIAWALAFALPLTLAVALRRMGALWNLGAIAWVVLLAMLSLAKAQHLFIFIWCGIGAAGLITWGVLEQRAARVNLGMAGFAITVLSYYFSDVMDKLDRSLSLIVLGLLFLGGGWLLERTRRRLVGVIRGATA